MTNLTQRLYGIYKTAVPLAEITSCLNMMEEPMRRAKRFRFKGALLSLRDILNAVRGPVSYDVFYSRLMPRKAGEEITLEEALSAIRPISIKGNLARRKYLFRGETFGVEGLRNFLGIMNMSKESFRRKLVALGKSELTDEDVEKFSRERAPNKRPYSKSKGASPTVAAASRNLKTKIVSLPSSKGKTSRATKPRSPLTSPPEK